MTIQQQAERKALQKSLLLVFFALMIFLQLLKQVIHLAERADGWYHLAGREEGVASAEQHTQI